MTSNARDVIDFVEENDVKFIRLAFCDLYGKMKNISIMPDLLPFALEQGIPFDGSSIRGFTDVCHSDLRLIPDPDTIHVLPWRPQQGRVVRFYCNITDSSGKRFACDSRGILQDAVAHAKQMGYVVKFGEECEFYLFRQDESGNDTAIPYDNGEYLDVSPADRCENIRREICLTLEEMDIRPETSHHEMGPGQNEIVFRFAEALSAADNLLTFKDVVQAVALRHGAAVSFDPKPLPDTCGNGLHINISVYRNQRNIFADENIKTYTQQAESFMAGILNRVKEISLFLNSTHQSYARLGEFEAPSYISWSRENRSQLMRIPFAFGDRRRCELRSADPAINPYLVHALLIEAGLEGMTEKMVLPPSTDMDMTQVNAEMLDSIDHLPASLKEAAVLAKDSDFVRRVVGETVLEKFVSGAEKAV